MYCVHLLISFVFLAHHFCELVELYRLIDLLLSLAETVVEIGHQLLYLPHECVDGTAVRVFEGLENCSTLKDLVRTYEYLLHLYSVSVRV